MTGISLLRQKTPSSIIFQKNAFYPLKNKQIYPAIVLILIIGFFIYRSNTDMATKNKSINENEAYMVALVTKFHSNRSFETYYYTFRYNGRVYEHSKHINGFDGEDHVGRYYMVRFSSENPHYSELFLDKEITDTAAIARAGF